MSTVSLDCEQGTGRTSTSRHASRAGRLLRTCQVLENGANIPITRRDRAVTERDDEGPVFVVDAFTCLAHNGRNSVPGTAVHREVHSKASCGEHTKCCPIVDAFRNLSVSSTPLGSGTSPWPLNRFAVSLMTRRDLKNLSPFYRRFLLDERKPLVG